MTADSCAEEGQEEQELKPEDWKLSKAELRLLHWHWANLEYGCSAPLNAVSLAHWNQVRLTPTFANMTLGQIGSGHTKSTCLPEMTDSGVDMPLSAGVLLLQTW